MQLLLAGPFSGASLEDIRARVLHAADTWKLPSHLGTMLAVVVSELITNVIVHADGEGRALLSIRAGRVFCQVSDSGPGLAQSYRAGWEPPRAGDPTSSRGLWIVRVMCDRLTIDSSPIGTTVTASINLARPA